jgi:hypothetical protein
MSEFRVPVEKAVVGTVVRGRIMVRIQSERLEGFWREVGRTWNRQASLKVPGCQDLLLTEEEWVTLWRGLLAVRCAYVSEESFPTYRALRPSRAQIPALMWEALTCFGHVSTEWGADYLVIGEAEWPTPDEFTRVYVKWSQALSIYALIFEVSRSLPESEKASPAFVLNASERHGSVLIQSSYPMKVTPRDTLWAVIALPVSPDLSPPKTVYLEWDRSLVISEILSSLRNE